MCVCVHVCERNIAARIKVSKKTKKDAKTGLSSTTNQTKFKLRCSKYMYTLVMDDASKAEKLRQSLPPSECNLPPSLRLLIATRKTF